MHQSTKPGICSWFILLQNVYETRVFSNVHSVLGLFRNQFRVKLQVLMAATVNQSVCGSHDTHWTLNQLIWKNFTFCWPCIMYWFLVNNPTWPTILFYVFIFIFNSLHVSSTSCSSSGERNCINTTSDSCRWPCHVQVGSDFTSDLHMKQPLTQSDSYQRLYWHNFSLLMMSTICSKHVQS